MHDDETLKFYANNAKIYAGRGRLPAQRLGDFLAALPAGGKVLELGCGGGQDARAMIEAGFDVTPTDGSPQLAEEAGRLLGRPVLVMEFEALAAQQCYDGVWASASLLHAPRERLAAILAKVHAALRPGGLLVASYKAGDAEGRDRFGRYYNYFDAATLAGQYRTAAPWSALALEGEAGSGYDGVPTDWLWVTARR